MFEIWAFMTNGFYKIATTNLYEDAFVVMQNHQVAYIIDIQQEKVVERIGMSV